jgi:hypothetical protein
MPLLRTMRRTTARARTYPFDTLQTNSIIEPTAGGLLLWIYRPPRLSEPARETLFLPADFQPTAKSLGASMRGYLRRSSAFSKLIGMPLTVRSTKSVGQSVGQKRPAEGFIYVDENEVNTPNRKRMDRWLAQTNCSNMKHPAHLRTEKVAWLKRTRLREISGW